MTSIKGPSVEFSHKFMNSFDKGIYTKQEIFFLQNTTSLCDGSLTLTSERNISHQ